ncbi:coiled-coil domain-containing protein [Methanosphaerula palustris]|uniref:Cell surface protein n=1 Tax=Methanosphaerula palustris (strain ATCC BAA-1556 / DSM 19958 / E1-9c) TaxID=521011 RepID=B8GDZ7_METPE|nr:hypothetical protein [Methanosphaerula palustris]ACL17498.1 hypothetical protein Mpal_2202 [Methanosphaerula palustris E1-9c]
MLKRIRELFRGKEESGEETVNLDEVSGLFDTWTTEIAAEREERTTDDQQVIREAVTALAGQVQALVPAEPTDEVHPKLAQVTRVSLPAFQKAMEAALAHPLGTDPALFYTEAADLLKCAIRAQQGQGRYLRAVLPDEMDGIKASIAEIGRAINRMTAVFADVNPRCDLIDQARGTSRRLIAAEKNVDTLKTLAAEERSRGAELRRQLAAAEEERTTLERSTPYQEYRALADRLVQEEGDRDAALAQERAIATTAGHLFKRAGKTSGLVQARRDLFSAAEERLEDLCLEDPVILSAATEAISMVRDGGLSLKNREEKALFSEARETEQIFAETKAKVRETGAVVAATERVIDGSAAGTRYQDLQKQVRYLEKQALTAEQSATDDEERTAAAEAEAKAAREALTTQLATIRGHPVLLNR